MSMVINLVEDHNIYICEGGPVYNGGVHPTPITYLTQWKIVGNSQVHTDPYLTSWKVSGNSVVQDGAIMSCGDLGQDGKYHVKISNGVTIFDIPLTEPLRKVNNVADSIEYADGVATLTRKLGSTDLGDYEYARSSTSVSGKYRYRTKTDISNIKQITSGNIAFKGLCAGYDVVTGENTYVANEGISLPSNSSKPYIYDENYNGNGDASALQQHLQGVELIYELATPTTELVDAPQIAVSPTDTYTSANVIPYSAFEHTENKEIWSCGEYNATDGKYHILVQPQGGSIADIALDEPLRKVNDVADTIEFPSDTEGKALVTRNLRSYKLANLVWYRHIYNDKYGYTTSSLKEILVPPINNNATNWNAMCNRYSISSGNISYGLKKECIGCGQNGNVNIADYNYTGADDFEAFKTSLQENDVELIITLISPTTELVDVPQIQEADSYSMIISQGGKAVEWSSFETNSE